MQQAQNKENTSALTQIHNHILLPDNLFTLLQDQPVNVPPSQGVSQALHLSPSLLLSNENQAGVMYTIDEFCHKYELNKKICMRLKDNGYACMHTFKYIKTADFKTNGFKNYEIAELKEAIRLWATDQH